MLFYPLAGFALVAVMLPFIPGWLELRRGKDKQALHINMEYSKTPFFFGDQFDVLLHQALPAPAYALPEPGTGGPPAAPEEYSVVISRPEKVLVIKEPVWAYEPFARVKRDTSNA